MKELYILSFTHAFFKPEELALLSIEPDRQATILEKIKLEFGFEEFMFIGTCNRIELIFASSYTLNKLKKGQLIEAISQGKVDVSSDFSERAYLYTGESAARHLFRVSSSLDSLVIGEREIITQVRQAYELCQKNNLSGDLIRLLMKKTIETAKDVFTYTDISKKPVSVVSLAFQKLLSHKDIHKNSSILMIGAGQTNTAFARNLKKQGFDNVVIFNRTLSKAQKLADEINAKAFSLEELSSYKQGFDVIVSCTGSEHVLVTPALFNALTQGDSKRKYLVDLAIPYDIDRSIAQHAHVQFIGMETLKDLANKNLKERQGELNKCETIIEKSIKEFKNILKERKIELAMKEVPEHIKHIKQVALSEIFAKDIEKLDDDSKAVIDKIISYMEKKYISGPMKMAKDIMLETEI